MTTPAPIRSTARLAMAARLLVLPLVLGLTASATGQPRSGARSVASVASINLHRSPRALLADHRALAGALDALRAQRPGVVDAYVIVAGLDGDPVFGREAREAARVLERRYDAAGRTIVLTAGETGPGETGPGETRTRAAASPEALGIALARVAELADAREDAVVLYTTGHGSPDTGLAYNDAARGVGAIAPKRLAAMLDGAGMPNRLLILSACYSGIFVPKLSDDTSVVITAAAADRSSFGCAAGNDWTYFGDALINRAFRKAQPLGAAFAEARGEIAGWEASDKLEPSKPQIRIGARANRWLEPLEARIPKDAMPPVGRSPAKAAPTNATSR